MIVKGDFVEWASWDDADGGSFRDDDDRASEIIVVQEGTIGLVLAVEKLEYLDDESKDAWIDVLVEGVVVHTFRSYLCQI